MIPRLRPQLGWEELFAALAFWRTNQVEEFERAFARKMGQKHAIAFPYGRTGLLLLIEALGLKNAEILMPAYTCVVVAHVVVKSGNIPVFIDSEPDSPNMDLDLVPKLVTGKTRALIATSIFGYPINLDKLDKIRKSFPHLRIIQDCAHSFAAEWKGRPVQREGDAAIFGLNISKLITSIFGGMVTTNDEQIAKRMILLRKERLFKPRRWKIFKRLLYLFATYISFLKPVYSIINRLENSGWLNNFVKYYDEHIIDLPEDHLEMLGDLEARVGIEQLNKYDRIISFRREVANYYLRQLHSMNQFRFFNIPNGATFSHFACLTEHRNKYIKLFLKKEIQLGKLIEYSIPEMAAYQGYAHPYLPCKNALRFSQSTLNLPISITSFRDAEKIICELRTQNVIPLQEPN